MRRLHHIVMSSVEFVGVVFFRVTKRSNGHLNRGEWNKMDRIIKKLDFIMIKKIFNNRNG